jgi:hypothetical protein
MILQPARRTNGPQNLKFAILTNRRNCSTYLSWLLGHWNINSYLLSRWPRSQGKQGYVAMAGNMDRHCQAVSFFSVTKF